MDERRIVNELKAYLTNNLRIDLLRYPIDIKVEGDALVVEGELENIAMKKRALLFAMSMPGLEGVIDRLRVRPRRIMSDREIENHLQNAMLEEDSLDVDAIEIIVKGAVINLEGSVPSLSHKRIAGVLAWWVPGTRDVINSIEVQPPEEDSDEEVTDAVRIVLDKDRLVDSTSISVSTRDWVVTLAGAVRDEIEKDVAEKDAWYVWGVNDVINRIEIIW